jgi:hypothetical protein
MGAALVDDRFANHSHGFQRIGDLFRPGPATWLPWPRSNLSLTSRSCTEVRDCLPLASKKALGECGGVRLFPGRIGDHSGSISPFSTILPL